MVKFKQRYRVISIILIYFMLCQLIITPGLLAFHAGYWHTGWHDLGDTDSNPSDTTNPETPPEPKNNPETGLDPVFIHQGEYLYSHQDLFIPGRGLSVDITRTYRSQKSHNGRFGFGWNMSYNIKIKKLYNNNLLILDGTGRKDEYTYDSVTDTYTSPPGFYDNLEANLNGTYTLTKKHGLKYNFDINGNLSSIIDRNNNQLTFTYDPSNKLPITGISKYLIIQAIAVIAYDYKLTTITDTAGRDITLDYYPDGRLKTITDFAGRTTTYTYLNDDLETVTTPPTDEYPSGLTTTYTYTDHNLETIKDARGQIYLTNHYDANDRVDWQTYGSGTSAVTYDEANNKTTIIDRKGFKTEYTFNANGNPIEKKVYTADLTDYYITTMGYNNDMELTRIIYPRGNSTEYTYDEDNRNGNLLEIRRKPLPESIGVEDIVTILTYEPRYNQVKTITDPRGNITTITYDYEDAAYGTENGRLMKITYPIVNGQTIETNLTYNTYGQVETVTDPNNNITRYDYYPDTGYLWKIINGYGVFDYTTEVTWYPAGNIKTIKNPRGYTTSYEFNNLNQLIQTTAPAPFNYITKYSYDENGKLKQADRQNNDINNPWITTAYTYTILDRLETITDDLDNITIFEYDNNGNRASITDAENNLTLYEYDERDLLWKVTDFENHITEYTYDRNGNLKTIKDARGNETAYAYDDFDLLWTTTYDDTTTETYLYDPAGNLDKKTDRKNQTIIYAYDELNRLDIKTYPDTAAVDYIYDKASRLTHVTDINGTISYAYDEVNRVTDVTYPGNKIVGYEYDSIGNRTKLTYPDNKFITYFYDKLNRLDNIKNAKEQIIADYTYDDLSRRSQLDYLNGTQTIYGYDPISRLTSLNNKVTATQDLISGFTYAYDDVYNRRYVIHGHEGDKGDVYTYDKIYQLTNTKYNAVDPAAESQTPGSSTFDSQMTYNLDDTGNRLSTTNGATTSYTPDNMNQYTDVGGTTYSYDLNGNLTSDGINTYQYDYENRLIQVTTPTDTITYKYDPFGRRIEKNVSGRITRFIYDGDQVIMETDDAGTMTAKYVYGTGIDEVIVMKRGSVYFYQYDGLGSVASITNSSGVRVESYAYDVYGKASIKDGSGNPLTESAIGNPYMFTGRRFDKESGLYYYRARYYDAEMGRFLTPDPLNISTVLILKQIQQTKTIANLLYQYGLQNPQMLNMYLYTANSPVNWVDPSGLLTWKERGFVGVVTLWRLLGPFKTYVEGFGWIKPIPGIGTVVYILTPSPLSDPYLGPDGRWYWPDGTPVNPDDPFPDDLPPSDDQLSCEKK